MWWLWKGKESLVEHENAVILLIWLWRFETFYEDICDQEAKYKQQLYCAMQWELSYDEQKQGGTFLAKQRAWAKITLKLMFTGKIAILVWSKIYMCTCLHAKLLQSCQTLQPYGLWPTRLLCPWDSPGKNTGVACHFLLQYEYIEDAKCNFLRRHLPNSR